MIGQINGHAVSSAKGIINGTERAVSNEERLNMLLEQARQVQTDVSPGNWTPTKLACVEIDKLRVDHKIDLEFIVTLEGMLDDYYVRCCEQEIEIEFLKRPLWVKIVGWFAR